jgi:TolA-binding protein
VDCEKFDRVVVDLLYEELDELTSAAAARHTEHCARCRGILAGLRATREVGVLPMIDPSEDLEPRILEAERTANAELPLTKRLGRALSIVANYTMRPELGMAALLLLMLGASLLFLRAHPRSRENLQVTERGVPEGEGESVAIVPMPKPGAAPQTASSKVDEHAARRDKAREEPRAAARAEPAPPEPSAVPAESAIAAYGSLAPDGGADDYAAAMSAFRAGRYAEAEQRFSAIASAGGGQAASAALMAAQATRDSAGCRAAAPRFDDVSTHYAGSAAANQATWEAADCFRALGEISRARRHYQALADVEGYSERAHRALDSLDQSRSSSAAKPAAHAHATTAPAASAR